MLKNLFKKIKMRLQDFIDVHIKKTHQWFSFKDVLMREKSTGKIFVPQTDDLLRVEELEFYGHTKKMWVKLPKESYVGVQAAKTWKIVMFKNIFQSKK